MIIFVIYILTVNLLNYLTISFHEVDLEFVGLEVGERLIHLLV